MNEVVRPAVEPDESSERRFSPSPLPGLGRLIALGRWAVTTRATRRELRAENLPKAEEYARTALSIAERDLGNDPTRSALSSFLLGETLQRSDRSSEALPHLFRAAELAPTGTKHLNPVTLYGLIVQTMIYVPNSGDRTPYAQRAVAALETAERTREPTVSERLAVIQPFRELRSHYENLKDLPAAIQVTRQAIRNIQSLYDESLLLGETVSLIRLLFSVHSSANTAEADRLLEQCRSTKLESHSPMIELFTVIRLMEGGSHEEAEVALRRIPPAIDAIECPTARYLARAMVGSASDCARSRGNFKAALALAGAEIDYLRDRPELLAQNDTEAYLLAVQAISDTIELALPEKRLELLEFVLEIPSIRTGDPALSAKYHLRISNVHSELGNHPAALRSLLLAAAQTEKAGLSLELRVIESKIASLAPEFDEHQMADHTSRRSLEGFVPDDSPGQQQKFYEFVSTRVHTLLEQNRPAEAALCVSDALKLDIAPETRQRTALLQESIDLEVAFQKGEVETVRAIINGMVARDPGSPSYELNRLRNAKDFVGAIALQTGRIQGLPKNSLLMAPFQETLGELHYSQYQLSGDRSSLVESECAIHTAEQELQRTGRGRTRQVLRVLSRRAELLTELDKNVEAAEVTARARELFRELKGPLTTR